MKFIFSDNQDWVDPNYDFIEDRFSANREPYWDDRYPHEMFSKLPYDGMLVSKAIVGGSKVAGRYSDAQASMLGRVGAREFLRFREKDFPGSMMIGDCGAFSYHKMHVPPYSPEEMVDFYGDGEFSHGCSVDHIIFDFFDDFDVANIPYDQMEENKRRYEITLDNAEKFLLASGRLSNRFTPMGVIQGWSPASMAMSALRLKKMGYDYLAIGGMVPLNAKQIKEALHSIREQVGFEIRIHILGFAKADQISEFKDFNITSFDTTSPLIRAFKDSHKNYYVHTRSSTLAYYTAIRIPQATENKTLKILAKEGKFSQEDFLKREKLALDAIRALDSSNGDLEETLNIIMHYSGPLLIGSDDFSSEQNLKKYEKLKTAYRRTLEASPWKTCECDICKKVSVEVIIFRGSNRNRRRGFHNLKIYNDHIKYLGV